MIIFACHDDFLMLQMFFFDVGCIYHFNLKIFQLLRYTRILRINFLRTLFTIFKSCILIFWIKLWFACKVILNWLFINIFDGSFFPILMEVFSHFLKISFTGFTQFIIVNNYFVKCLLSNNGDSYDNFCFHLLTMNLQFMY